MICITYINLTQQENAYNLKKEKKKESWGGGGDEGQCSIEPSLKQLKKKAGQR